MSHVVTGGLKQQSFYSQLYTTLCYKNSSNYCFYANECQSIDWLDHQSKACKNNTKKNRSSSASCHRRLVVQEKLTQICCYM